MACCGNNPSLFYPKILPTGGGNGNSGATGPGAPTIQNGRLTPRRNAYFSRRLHRASQLLQHPGQATYRELCLLAWATYALYRFLFSFARHAWRLLAVVDVRLLCGLGQSVVACNRAVAWRTVSLFGLYLADVVPWAVVCAVVVFVGEEVRRQRR